MEAFTAREREVVESHRTPARVQRFLSRMPYNWERCGATLRSFREVVRRGEAHCLEAALAAAVILEQHAYPPLVDFASTYYVGTRVLKPLLAQATGAPVDVADPASEWNRWFASLPAVGDYGTQKLFVFRKRGLWGAVARSRDLGLHGRRPVFKNLRQLAWSYFDTYVDSTGRITGYGVTNLYELGNYDWRFSRKNVWKVERHLQEIPHRAIHSSDRRYERLLSRYKEFRARHPEDHLTDYASRDTWMI